MKKGITILSILITYIIFSINAIACPMAYHDEGYPLEGAYAQEGSIEAISEEININAYSNDIITEECPTFSVSNKYLFSNNSSEDIKETLFQPFVSGRINYYYYDNFSSDAIITVDDKEVSYKKRYAYVSYDENGENVGIDRLNNDYDTTLVINKDTKLYHYTLKIDESSVKEKRHISFFYDFNKDCRYIIKNIDSYNKEIYSEEVLTIDDFFFYYYNFRNDKKTKAEVNVSFVEEDSLTYYQYYMQYYDEFKEDVSDISEVDYINACLRYAIDDNYLHPLSKYSLKMFYEYDIVIEKDREATTEITMPICPEINGEYSPCYYTFDINLKNSNIKCSNIKINFNTDLYLTDDTIFNKVDNTYSVTFDDISKVSLSIETNPSLNPSKNDYTNNAWFVAGIILMVIVVAVFFVIPLTISIIFFKTNYKKDKEKGRIMPLIEAILSLISLALVATCYIFEIGILRYFIPFILVLVIICYFIERFKFKLKVLNRYFISFIYLFLITLGYICDLKEDYEEILIIITFIFSLIFYAMSLSFLLKKSVVKTSKKQDIYKGKGYYLIGFINGYSLFVFILIVFLTVIIVSILIAFYNKWYIVLIFFIILIAEIMAYAYIHFKRMYNCFNKYIKTLDYETLERRVDDILNNPKIHPETKNYYNMMMFSCSILYDLDKAAEYYNSIFIPFNNEYKKTYDKIRINYLLDFESLNEEVNKYGLTKPNKKDFKDSYILLLQMRAYFFGKSTSNIDKLAPLDVKYPYARAFNMYIQIFYYRIHDQAKALALEEEFREKYSMLKVLVSDISGEDIRTKWKELTSKREKKEE